MGKEWLTYNDSVVDTKAGEQAVKLIKKGAEETFKYSKFKIFQELEDLVP